MGEVSVILEGVENEQASLSLYSTIHGAGRVMGRMEAKGKRDRISGEWKREPKVTQEMMDVWVNGAKVELRGGGVDESPHYYKRLPDVRAEHSDSVRILHTLKPLGVATAGKDVYDPFKD
jgi:tRNA-splicing ligase RtcB (3'-phosphate/5'-hydroxy nucleic acid ligase)